VVETLLSRFGYLGVFLLLAGAGVGVPVPEEPTQLLAGVLAERGTLVLWVVLLTCWAGIVAGDLVWFRLARRLGPRVLERRPLRGVLTPARRARIESHLSRHGFLTVMVSRHLSGLRLPAFALAATHGVSTRRFVLADGLSALLSVPLVVSAGYLGARHLASVRAELRRVELLVLLAAGAAAVVWAVARHLRRRTSGVREGRGAALPAPPAPED
jgi:membrane protein DedA with SNARE-associated domain